MDDAQLLHQYATEGSEAAFQTLVRRHLGLVHGAALRQLGDRTLADDVAQAVFLLLARKAGRLGRGVVVSGWLYRTTGYVASRVRRSEFRRRQREQEALDMSQLQSTDEVWKRPSPELDEALSRLGETDRNVILLRFGRGHSHREVGEVLGLSEEAVRKRAQRALDALRTFLSRAGITVSAGVLSTLLVERINAQPPAGLEMGILVRVRDGAAVPGPVGDIVRDTLAGWRAAWISWAAVVGMAVVVLLGVATLSSRSAAPAPAKGVPSVAANPVLGGHAVPSTAAAPGPVFRLKVVSAADGAPLPGVSVVARFVVGTDWSSREDLVTAADGVCEIPVPGSGLMRFDAGAHASGRSARFFTWITNWQEPLPGGHVLALKAGRTVGGEVRNVVGEPVPGVEVWLDDVVGDASWREPREDRERAGLPVRTRIATTDAKGRWSSSEVSIERNLLRLQFDHPEFALAEVSLPTGDSEQQPDQLTRLLAGKDVTILKPGTVAFGSVVDEAGNPITDARIAPSWSEPGVQSGSDGTFALTRRPRGPVSLVATAEGFSPAAFTANAGGAPVLVRLSPGGVVRVRVVDFAGSPIPGATVGLDEGFGLGAIGWDGRTDDEGRVEWRGAPKGRDLRFMVSAEGYAMSGAIALSADREERTVVLRPVPVIRGRVVDAVTHANVGAFRAIPGSPWGAFDRSSLSYGRDGQFTLRLLEEGPHALLFEADGYESRVEVPREVDGVLRCDVELRPMVNRGPLRGLVRTPDGRPVAGVDVLLVTLDWGVTILPSGRLQREPEGTAFRTDSEGRFELPRDSRGHSVVVSGPEGFARVRARDFGADLELILQPWGRIEAEGATVKGTYVVDAEGGSYQARGMSIRRAIQATAEGRLTVDRLPAGPYIIREASGRGCPTLVRVGPGETARVHLDAGRTVTGRVVAGPGEPVTGLGKTVLKGRLGTRISKEPWLTDRPIIEIAEWHRQADRWESPEVQEGLGVEVVVPVAISQDGSFRTAGVPAGAYRLTVDTRGAGESKTGPGGSFGADLDIPPAEAEGSPAFDVGVVMVRADDSRSRSRK